MRPIMHPKCESLIEDIQSKYVITNLDKFLDTTAESIKVIPHHTFYIYNKNDANQNKNTSIGMVDFGLARNNKYIYINDVHRRSEYSVHKGIIKDILRIIICKAHQLNLNIEFTAEPYVYQNQTHKNSSSLYRYYNSLGFKRENKTNVSVRNNNTRKKSWCTSCFRYRNTRRKIPWSIHYMTTPSNMKNIINSYPIKSRQMPYNNISMPSSIPFRYGNNSRTRSRAMSRSRERYNPENAHIEED